MGFYVLFKIQFLFLIFFFDVSTSYSQHVCPCIHNSLHMCDTIVENKFDMTCNFAEKKINFLHDQKFKKFRKKIFVSNFLSVAGA